MRIVWKSDLRGILWNILAQDLLSNELHDASYKTCLVMPMQSRDNDKIFQLRVQMLDNHDNDAPMRCRIAVVVQCNDGMFHAQTEMVHMRQCNCHDAVPMIHTP